MSINQVAKLAGVSNSTVSRVINNHPRVAPETAEAVRRAMEQLNYTPSDRRPGPKPSLRTRTGATNIAFLVLGTARGRSTPAFEDLLFGVSTAASENDLNLVFNHVPSPDDLPDRMIDDRVQGLLLHGALPSAEVRERLRRVPTVWLMGNRQRPDWGDQVMPDGYEVGVLAARYLIEKRHRNLAFLNLDSGHWPSRIYGHAFVATAGEAGAAVHVVEQARQPTVEYWRAHSEAAVQMLVGQFLAISPRPTGLFVSDDMQVALVQPALIHAGIEIGPGKVEIISCNNERPYLAGLNPRPGVIDIRAASIGRRGVDQLIWRLEHPNIPERMITTVEPFVVNSDGQAMVDPTAARQMPLSAQN